jgi:hypothetical protein
MNIRIDKMLIGLVVMGILLKFFGCFGTLHYNLDPLRNCYYINWQIIKSPLMELQ